MRKKTCNWIFWCCSFDWKKSKEERKRKKETKTRNQKKAKKKDKKEERKKRRKETDRERETLKEGGQKRLREKERETLKINKKSPFQRENKFFCINQPKNKTKTTNQKKQQKTNKEGLGPGEVALWATSPDPSTVQKKQKNQNKKHKKKTAKIPKNSFSVISQMFPLFWVTLQKFPFFDTLAQKARTPKTL